MTTEKIGLKEVISALRSELSDSIREAENKDIRFDVGDVNIEFEVLIEQSDKLQGEGKVKFNLLPWGGSIGGSAETGRKNADRQKITIQLKPKNIKTGGSVSTHGTVGK